MAVAFKNAFVDVVSCHMSVPENAGGKRGGAGLRFKAQLETATPFVPFEQPTPHQSPIWPIPEALKTMKTQLNLLIEVEAILRSQM